MAASLTSAQNLKNHYHVFISSRFQGSVQRIKLDVNITNDVIDDLRLIVAAGINRELDEFELVYRGKVLCDRDDLTQYGITPGVTIHALPKRKPLPTPTSALSKAQIKEVKSALTGTLQNPASRATVERVISDDAAMTDIIASVPGIKADPAAHAILQWAGVLGVLCEATHADTVLAAHPSLGHAVLLLAAHVKQASTTTAPAPRAGAYSLDQMSDDEDLMDTAPGPAARGAAITASQLAAALAVAGAAPPAAASSTGVSTGNDVAAASSLTDSFVRQAVQQAAAPSEEQIQLQLAQLRDMGISDEAVARQALAATGGDLQAAIELIFSDI